MASQLAPNQTIISRDDGTYFVRTFTGGGQYIDSSTSRIGEFVTVPSAAAQSADASRTSYSTFVAQQSQNVQQLAAQAPTSAVQSEPGRAVTFDYIRQQGTLADQLFVAQQTGLPLASVQANWADLQTKLGSKSYTALTEKGISEAQSTGKAFIPGIGTITVAASALSLSSAPSQPAQQPVSAPYRPSPLKPISLFPSYDEQISGIKQQLSNPSLSMAEKLALTNQAAQLANQRYNVQQLPPDVMQSLALSPTQQKVLNAGVAIESLPGISFLKERSSQIQMEKRGDWLGDTSKDFVAGIIRSPEMFLKTGVAGGGIIEAIRTNDRQALSQGQSNSFKAAGQALADPNFYLGVFTTATIAGVAYSNAQMAKAAQASQKPVFQIEPKTSVEIGSRTEIIAQSGQAGPQAVVAEISKAGGREVATYGLKSGPVEGSSAAIGIESTQFTTTTSPTVTAFGKSFTLDFIKQVRQASVAGGEVEALAFKNPVPSSGPLGAQPTMLVQTQMVQSFTPQYTIPVSFGKGGAPTLSPSIFGDVGAVKGSMSISASYSGINVPVSTIVDGFRVGPQPFEAISAISRDAPYSISASYTAPKVTSFSEISPAFVKGVSAKDVVSVTSEPIIQPVDALAGLRQQFTIQFPEVRQIRTLFSEEGGSLLASQAKVSDIAVELSGQNLLYRGVIPTQRVGGQLVSGTVTGEVYSPFGGGVSPKATLADIFPSKPLGGGGAPPIEVLGPTVSQLQVPKVVLPDVKAIAASQSQIGLQIGAQAGMQSTIPRVAITPADIMGATAFVPAAVVSVQMPRQQPVTMPQFTLQPPQAIEMVKNIQVPDVREIVQQISRQNQEPLVRILQTPQVIPGISEMMKQTATIRQPQVQIPEQPQIPLIRQPALQLELQTPQQTTIRIPTVSIPPVPPPTSFAPFVPPPPPPQIQIMPPLKPPWLPGEGSDFSRIATNYDRQVKGRYVPSLTAAIFNIRGKPGGTEMTGFAVRPLPNLKGKGKGGKR